MENTTVFITGSNRGLGAALVREFQQRGALKIYAASRTGVEIPGTYPIRLDITRPDQVREAVCLAPDVTLLINNAGVAFNTPLLNTASTHNARQEMEVNYFGTLAMCRAFTPVLSANGGGAIMNIAALGGKVNLPAIGSVCASKAALISLTQSIRVELAAQRTRVMLVMPGPIDTEMTRRLPVEKANPSDVASAVLDAVSAGHEDIYPDMAAHLVGQQWALDPIGVEKSFASYLH